MLAAGALQAQTGGQKTADIGYAVYTANSQVYIAGQVPGAIPGQTYFGANDAFVQAFNQNGKLLWSAQLGTSQNDVAYGVAADSTGVYVGGVTYGAFPGQTNGGNSDAFIAKYDLTGVQQWLHEFGNGGVDRIQALTSDGTNVYATGYTGDSLMGNQNLGGQDCFVQAWSQTGKPLWTTQFGTAGTDRCYGIAQNSSGIYIAGRTDGALPGNSSIGGIDAFVAAFDFNGNALWYKQFGTTADERGWGIALDPTGIYVTGRTEGSMSGERYKGDDDAFVIKFDYTGNQLWVDEFGTERFDRGTAMATDATGAYGAGYTQGTIPPGPSAGFVDCYIRKYDTAGDLLWSIQFGSDQYDDIWGAATDSTGVYVTGSAGGQLPGQTGTPHTFGFFLQKFDTNGNVLWVREISVAKGS